MYAVEKNSVPAEAPYTLSPFSMFTFPEPDTVKDPVISALPLRLPSHSAVMLVNALPSPRKADAVTSPNMFTFPLPLILPSTVSFSEGALVPTPTLPSPVIVSPEGVLRISFPVEVMV